MKLFAAVLSLFAAVNATEVTKASNGCVSFSVSSGTGCAWMCNYCAGALGTNNYYFTTDVCKYEQGTGCVGNPQAGVTYTCCAAGEDSCAEEEF